MIAPLERRATWIVRQPAPAETHHCDPPTREHHIYVPCGPAAQYPRPEGCIGTGKDCPVHGDRSVSFGALPDGQVGDVWRCACGHAWKIAAPAPLRDYGGYSPRGPERWVKAGPIARLSPDARGRQRMVALCLLIFAVSAAAGYAVTAITPRLVLLAAGVWFIASVPFYVLVSAALALHGRRPVP